MATDDPRTVVLKRVRGSFMDGLVEKQKTSDEPGAKEKFNWNFINEASSPTFAANNAKILEAIRAAGEKQWKNPDAWRDIQEEAPKRVTFRKGERFKNREGQVYAGYEGNTAFSVTGPNGGQKRPRLLDRHKRPVEEKDIADVFYGGSYVDAIVSFYGTDKGSRGIFATCELIRSHQEGEPMAGGYRFDESDLDELDDFEGDGMGAPSAAPASDLDGLL